MDKPKGDVYAWFDCPECGAKHVFGDVSSTGAYNEALCPKCNKWSELDVQ
jgi:predicted RNA-binding Zn-ribbon protein involved in translation (DUF1610 family)